MTKFYFRHFAQRKWPACGPRRWARPVFHKMLHTAFFARFSAIPSIPPDSRNPHTSSALPFPPTPSPTSFPTTSLPTPTLLPQSPLSPLHSFSLAPKKFLCYNKRLPPTSPAPPAHTATLPRFRSLPRTPTLPPLSKCRISIHLQRQSLNQIQPPDSINETHISIP